MTKIKICGLTLPGEAAFLNEIHADYAGMVVFFPKSRRCVTLADTKAIRRELEPSVKSVAVAVSPTEDEIRAVADAGFDLIQIHGSIEEKLLAESPLPVIRAFNGVDPDELNRLRSIKTVRAVLFDAAQPGSGKTFDWTTLKQLPRTGKEVFLAGGLTPENVADAIRAVRPDGVDVSSGVERAEGGKSFRKILRFAAAVRASHA